MKKRTFGILIGAALIISGCLLIMEGGFHISYIAYDDVPKYAAENAPDGAPSQLEYSEQKDAAVSAFVDENNVYIYEFSRNTIFNRYSLTDTHVCGLSDLPFHSVVSTAFFDYPYSIDSTDLSIHIYEKTISGTFCYSLFLLLMGGAVIAYSLKKKQNA